MLVDCRMEKVPQIVLVKVKNMDYFCKRKVKKQEGRRIENHRSLCFFKLCPNCARQGQIVSNISKRNQKLVKNIEWK
jgi:hypothetical protein